MFPTHLHAPKIRRRGRQAPDHAIYQCPWCLTDLRLRGNTMFCTCGWQLELL